MSLRVARGERLAVIGPNGAGKTTLFNLLCGELRPSGGVIRIQGRDVTREDAVARVRRGLSRSFQQNTLFDEVRVRDNLALAVLARRRRSWVFWRDPARDPDIAREVEDLARRLALAEVLDQPVGTLAYGTRRQLEIALALAREPEVLMLDEPTAGMSPEETRAILALVKQLPESMTVVLIEHDLDLVFEFARRVVVLDYGRVVFDGTPEEARRSPVVREIYMGSEA